MSGDPTERLERWGIARLGALIFCVALAAHVVGLGGLPVIDRDEPRFAEAAREMLENGDPIVPRFNGAPRYDKPPLIYWCQIAAYSILGETEFAARLPSAVAAALCSVIVFGFGTRLWGRREGLLAALFFGTSLQVIVHARAAVADMAMVLMVAGGLWAGWEATRLGARGGARFWGWWCAFVALLALGFLAKGPVAWAPLLPFGMALARRGSPGGGARAGVGLATLALVLSMGIVAFWGVPALLSTGGDFFRVGIGRHVVHRSISAMEGHGLGGLWGYLFTLPFYLLSVFASLFPWSIWLPWLTRRLRAAGWPGAADPRGYLVVATVAVFVAFTLVRTKLPHYILPAFPALALLLAREWVVAGRGAMPALRFGCVMVAVGWGVGLVVGPLARPLFPSAAVADVVRPWLRPETRVGALGYMEPSLVWYLRGVIDGPVEFLGRREAETFLDEGAPALLLVTAEREAEVAAAGGVPPDVRRSEVRGINFARGLSPVRLVAILRE